MGPNNERLRLVSRTMLGPLRYGNNNFSTQMNYEGYISPLDQTFITLYSSYAFRLFFSPPCPFFLYIRINFFDPIHDIASIQSIARCYELARIRATTLEIELVGSGYGSRAGDPHCRMVELDGIKYIRLILTG